MQPSTVLQLAVVAVLCYHINGYVFDQLLSTNDLSVPRSSEQNVPVVRFMDENVLAAQLNDGRYAKKSLKKFQGHGSRNCFFSPITCMIQHDVSKYRKLVDNSYYGTGGVTKRLRWQRD
ncbi:hypothetical protein L596_002627 [Steinernema carpocapsae]|uniref:Uncharacterized protein n=1 Tax=Steinernema carpocapsae TaxID=34508 RepID=A0A4V6YSV2_STECR|nr:hypothetical protein L596_002627 [Steinernema carpocapsae]